MLESLVWSIVERYAHTYIKGFKPDSLKVSLWEGEITMNNVELNTDALNLPIKLERGFAQSVKARIPWTKLSDKPVIVHVKGVALEIVPNPSFASTASASAAAVSDSVSTQNCPPRSDAPPGQTPADSLPDGFAPADTETYSGRVRQAVIDNIQIQISDIHVSFREPSSSAFVMHFTIDSLRLHPLATSAANSSVPPSPASRSRSNSATTTTDALFGSAGGLGALLTAAATAACLHADCAAHAWPDLRREVALLERVLCRQLVLHNVCVFVEESGDAISESIWQRLRRKQPTPAADTPPESASAPYANLHCLVRDVGLRATLTTSPSSLFFATLVVDRAIRMHVRDVDVKLVCLFVNQVRYLLEQVSGSNTTTTSNANKQQQQQQQQQQHRGESAPFASEHVRELWESTNWIWGVAPQGPSSPRPGAATSGGTAAPTPKRRDSAKQQLDASLNADDFAMMPKGDLFRGLFCEVDVAALELLVTEHLEHADVVTRSVEVIQRDLARMTLERVRVRLAARTNDLHCHMSLGAPSLVSLIDVNSSAVPLFSPLAAGAEHADWLHVAYTHATHQQPSLRIALKPASLVFAPLLFNRLARVASIIEPYTRTESVHESIAEPSPSIRPLNNSDSEVIAPLTRDEAAEAARMVSKRLDASFRRVALNELSSLAQRVDDSNSNDANKRVRVSIISPLVQIALAVDTTSANATRLVFDCKEITVANFTDTVAADAEDDTILRLQSTQVSATMRARPLLLPTELEAFVRAPLADGGVRIDAEAAVLRLSVDSAVVRELEALMSRASLQWNNGVDANEHVWRAPTASRSSASTTSAQRRRAPRVIADWRPLLTPHLRRRTDTTYYRASVLAKSVVLALGAPQAPVAELRADGVCVTAWGHARSGRDCTRFALSICEATVVELDGTLEHTLLSASAVAQVSSPATANSLYATPAGGALDRTAYGTPLGRSFVAPSMTASRFGIDSMRLDSPFRATASAVAPEFDDEHHSRSAALGAPLPFQAEQRFMSPDSSMIIGTPPRGGGGAQLAESTPVSALSAFRRAGGRMFGELRTPALTLSFVEVRVPDAPSSLPSVKLALTVDGVRAIYCNRGFAAIERALTTPPSAQRATQQARLESLTAAQVRWQYLTLRLLQRARDRLLHGTTAQTVVGDSNDDESADSSSTSRERRVPPPPPVPQPQSVVRFGDHASWCRLLAARVARNAPHWLKWSELSIFLEAVLNKLSISLRNCIVSTPQQMHAHDPRAAVPRLDFVVPHAHMSSVTRSGRALAAMVLSGQLLDVRVVLALPLDAAGDGDDALDDDSDDALRNLPPFYRACAGAVRAVTVLRKDKLAARLVSRLNWRRSSKTSKTPTTDDNDNAVLDDDDDDDDADNADNVDNVGEPLQKAPTAVALNTLDVFVGDFEFRMPIDDLRVFGGVVRSLGSRDEFVAVPAPATKSAVLQKYHFRVFSRHASAVVDCVNSVTSQVHAIDAVRTLALESRTTSLVVALSANGDLSLALDFDALLCHCMIDDVATFTLSEHQFESGLTQTVRGNVLRPLHESTRRIVGGPVHGDGERMPHLRFEVDVATDGGPSRLRWLLRGHELRLQPRVSRTLRAMWRAMRGTADEVTSSIFEDVDPQSTPSTGLDVTLRVEDSTLLFHSRPVTCAVAADALSMQLQTERGATSLIQVAADNFLAAAIDDLYVDELASVRDLVFSMHLVDVAADNELTALLLDDDAGNFAHFLSTLTGCRENAVLEISSRLRHLSARIAPNVALSAIALCAGSFILTDGPPRSKTELGERLLADLQQPAAWLRVDVSDAQWAASVSSRALASDIRVGAFDAHVVGAALARAAGVSAAQRRRRQRYAVVASLLTLRALSVATVIGDANVLPLLTDDAIDALRSTVMAFERHSQQRRTSLARGGDDDSESSASVSQHAVVAAAAQPAAASLSSTPDFPLVATAASSSSNSGSISRLSMPRVASEHASLARAASSHSLRAAIDLALTIRIDSVVASLPLAESAFRATSAALATAVAFRGVAPAEPAGNAPTSAVSAAAWRKSSLRQRVRLATWFECGAIKAQCVDVDGAKLSVELNASLLDSVLLLDDLEATWASVDELSLHSVHTRVNSVISLALVAPHAPRARTASAVECTLALDDERRLTINARFARHQLGLTPGWQVSVGMLRLAVQLQARLATLSAAVSGGSSEDDAAAKFEPPTMRTFRATIELPDGFAVSCVRDEIEFARMRLGDTSVSVLGTRDRLLGTVSTTAFELQCLSDTAPTPVIVQVCDLLASDDVADDGAAVSDVVGVELSAAPSGAIGVRVRLAPDVLVHADFRLLDTMRRDFAPFVEAFTSVHSAAVAASASAGAPLWRVARIEVDSFTLRARATMLPMPSIVPTWIAAVLGDSGDMSVSFDAADYDNQAALSAHFVRALWRQVPLQLLRNFWPLGMQVATLYDAAREPATDLSDRFALWLVDAVSALYYSVEGLADATMRALTLAACDSLAEAMGEERRLLHRRAAQLRLESTRLRTLVMRNLTQDVAAIGRRFESGWRVLPPLRWPRALWRLFGLLRQCLAQAAAANIDVLMLAMRVARRRLPVSGAMRRRDKVADATRLRLHRSVDAVPQQVDARWIQAVASCVVSLDGAQVRRNCRRVRARLTSDALHFDDGAAELPLSVIAKVVTVDVDPFAVLIESPDNALGRTLLGVEQPAVVFTWATLCDRDMFLDELATYSTTLARQHLHWQNLFAGSR